MKTRIILSLLLGLALVAGCKNTTTVENSDVGSFRGNVALLTAEGDTLSNYAGATAQIQGTTFHATSNAAGDWEIDNVPAGIYNILLTKPGFDTLIIPQYQFSGAGTSFVVGTAIQAIPQDSMVITLNNTIEEYYDSAHTSYLGLLTITGNLAGPDSLLQASFDLAFGPADSNGSTINTYIVNRQVPPGTSRGYSVNTDGDSYKSGTVVTVSSSVWAVFPKNFSSYSHFQQAVSSYSVKRTFVLP
jgi:hypothetical protein